MFYDYNYRLLHIENKVISVLWTIYYNEIGKMEMHFDLGNSRLVETLNNNDDILMVQGDLQAVITGRQYNEEGVLYGRTLNYFLYNGVTPAFANRSGDVETLTRQFVNESCGSFLSLGEIAGVSKQIVFTKESYTPTFEVVRDCLVNDHAGHLVRFEPAKGQMIFQVLKGEKNSLMLSYGNKNVTTMQHTMDAQNYYTGAWYKETQPKDAEGNTPDPIWKYITKDETKTGIYKRDAVVSADNATEARQALDQLCMERTTKTDTQRLKWKKDYELGDIVRLQNQIGSWSETGERRIVGVDIWFENNEEGEQPILEGME